MLIQSLNTLYQTNQYNQQERLNKSYKLAAASDILLGVILLIAGGCGNSAACLAIGSLYTVGAIIVTYHMYKTHENKEGA